jgi:hypothetical protein
LGVTDAKTHVEVEDKLNQLATEAIHTSETSVWLAVNPNVLINGKEVSKPQALA